VFVSIALGIALLIFSFYKLFLANDAVSLGMGILRVMLTVLGLIALRFKEPSVLASSVFLYAVISIFVLSVARKEVQIKS
jgi:hypothetical protein